MQIDMYYRQDEKVLLVQAENERRTSTTQGHQCREQRAPTSCLLGPLKLMAS